MQALTDFVNTLWSILTIVADILAIIFIIARFTPKLRETPFCRFFSDRSLVVAFIVSLLAMLGSLTYSNIIGYAPCELCWFQRIFMYPQAFLMGIAMIRKDSAMRLYGIVLSTIGAAIALYHYIGQLGYASLSCGTVGYSAACSQRFVLQYGYVTIPMMAFSAFALIATTLWLSRATDASGEKVIS